MRVLCCPDTARFMVISRIDNIKYAGPAAGRDCQIKQQFINPHLDIGHGKEAQFWRGRVVSVGEYGGNLWETILWRMAPAPHIYSALC